MPDISQAAVVLAGTRGFTVTKGALFTANLGCEDDFADVRLQDSAQTAIFAPT
jgi:stage V sporulation protein SpoVS